MATNNWSRIGWLNPNKGKAWSALFAIGEDLGVLFTLATVMTDRNSRAMMP